MKYFYVMLVWAVSMMSASAIYYHEVMADSPEAYYNMNFFELVSFRDFSENEHDGLSVVNVTAAGYSPVDVCVAFSNGLVELDLQLDPSAGDFSIEAVIRFDEGDINRTIIHQRDGRGIFYRVSSGYLRSYLGGQGINSSAKVSLDEWHHVAMTVQENGSSDILRFYIDGEFAGSGTTDIESDTGNWVVGNGSLIGALDQLAVYNTSLSPERIRAHYLSIFPGVVTITNLDENVALDAESYVVGGTNNQWVVGTLTWANPAADASGSVAVSGTEFEIPGIPLALGANVITVKGSNAVGAVTSDSVTITRTHLHVGDSPVHYVSTAGMSVWPYTNWVAAATNIQDAVHAAAVGDTVLITNGIYISEAQVDIAVVITVKSVNGPGVTVVDGQKDHRCFNLGSAACVLSGFTMQNGKTSGNGGGVYCSNTTPFITNCVLVGNSAGGNGGGSCYGHLVYCRLSDNSAGGDGGGSYTAFS